jgi:hypothetical protein
MLAIDAMNSKSVFISELLSTPDDDNNNNNIIRIIIIIIISGQTFTPRNGTYFAINSYLEKSQIKLRTLVMYSQEIYSKFFNIRQSIQ